MAYLNVEIKARCANPEAVRNYLKGAGAEFRGTDRQTDTYFRVANGRLKLREGNIENNLIYYERSNQAGSKDSKFHLVRVPDAAALKVVLTRANGIKIVVEKVREIYYIGNVKFHIDEVPGLGSFVEIEAGNIGNELTQADLKRQCDHYVAELKIGEQDLLGVSYSDMMMGKPAG